MCVSASLHDPDMNGDDRQGLCAHATLPAGGARVTAKNAKRSTLRA